MLLKYQILILEDLQGEDEPITGLTTPPPTALSSAWQYMNSLVRPQKIDAKDMTSISDPNLTQDFFLKIVLDSYPRS